MLELNNCRSPQPNRLLWSRLRVAEQLLLMPRMRLERGPPYAANSYDSQEPAE